MFTIYSQNVEGRKYDRYFRSWKRAKEELDKDASELQGTGRWKVTRKSDCMNRDKGFYEYQYDLLSLDGEKMTLALIDGHFSD